LQKAQSPSSPVRRSATRALIGVVTLAVHLLLAAQPWAAATPAPNPQVSGVLARLETAYAAVPSYQTDMEVREYRKGKYQESKRFRYTFRKPDQLRIDMRAPQPGTVLIYPDQQGKVTLRPGGWSGFVTLHLAPDNAMLASGSGQRIDQSDFGLLLRNMRHSLTGQRRGEVLLSETPERVTIEVLADDHFLPGVQTLYRFVIDKATWLPQEVHESTAQGAPKRISIYGNLRTALTLNDGFFRVSDKKEN
jgi:outer membrane lipoprotein-sorting protein